MSNWLSRLWSFVHLNRLHWSASKRRIFMSMIAFTFVIGLVLSIYTIRETHYDDLLRVYEKKHPLDSNGLSSLYFYVSEDFYSWDGLPTNFSQLLSDKIDLMLEESDLDSIESEIFIAIHMDVFVLLPSQNRTTHAQLCSIPEAVLLDPAFQLKEGEIPANSSEVIINAESHVIFDLLGPGGEFLPENSSISILGREYYDEEIDTSNNQTLSITGAVDRALFESELAERFPRDFIERASWSDFLTSHTYLVEIANGFSAYFGQIYGTFDIVWNVKKIKARDIGVWQDREQAFRQLLNEKEVQIQGTRAYFWISEELLELFADFKEELQRFDLTYILLSIPLLILILLILLEVNSLGNESQAREIKLLYLNGVRFSEAASLLLIERMAIAFFSSIIGIVISPLFVNLAQTILPGFPSWIDPVESFQRMFSVQTIILVTILVFLTSSPSIIRALRQTETIRGQLPVEKRVWKRSHVVLVTLIGFAVLLLVFSELIQAITGSEGDVGEDISFFGVHLDFMATSIILLAIPALLIRIINELSSRVGSRLWHTYSHKITIGFQLFREEAKHFARPALVIFLMLMILIPALFVSPSIDIHLEEESKLVVGSDILFENWNETISPDIVYNISNNIANASLVRHILADGAFPPLREKQSILVVDPQSFAEVAHLELASKGPLAPIDSIKALSNNKTLLLGSKERSALEKGESVSFKAWERIEIENRTEFVPHQLDFRIEEFFDLFPLLSHLTRSTADEEEILRYYDEIVMSYDNWLQLSAIFQLDGSITYSISTKLLIRLKDPAQQEQVSKKFYKALGLTANTSISMKESFESPFQGSYVILSNLTIMIGMLVVVAIAITSANTLINRRREGIEVLLRMGMARRSATLVAAQEFAIAILIPTILGTLFGLAYLFSMEKVLSVYTNLLEFQWLIDPIFLIIAVFLLVFFTYIIWVGSFYLAISRYRFAAEE
ncbi:MAG: FtsX-like permease family protein [Candidatus Hodarchaeota archaeon]